MFQREQDELSLSNKNGTPVRPTFKQSGESVESVPKKKRKATVGSICRKARFDKVLSVVFLSIPEKTYTADGLL